MTAKRILVIDDSAFMLRVTKVSLEQGGGWEVLTASSGSEGLAKAGTERPDAILLDVEMPEMDGLTTCRKLQSDPSTQSIPVILLTAAEEPTDGDRFAELAIAAVIGKPFDPSKLASRVAKCLGWSL